MKIQALISTMQCNPKLLAEKMNLSSEAIIINQCDAFAYEEFMYRGHKIRAFSFAERGVGLSRNNALLRADGDISLFSDEDIRYTDGYAERIWEEFDKHSEADVILFNFEVCEERRTYYNTVWKRVRWYNCGRYPTFSFAVRTDRLHEKNITFSLLFGGGAKYSNGEDSLFLQECIKKKLKVFASPVVLGSEEGRPSTWFHGYTEKFFRDRGVLYHYLYGRFSYLLAYRFFLRNRKKVDGEMAEKQAWNYLKQGISQAKNGAR